MATEAATELERLLDPKAESTITVRSVIGCYLETLAYLDADWLRRNLLRVLPADPRLSRLQQAALIGYYSFARPSGFMFRNFRQIFQLGLAWIQTEPVERGSHRPQERVVEYMMAVYWWGLDSLEDKDSLLCALFAGARGSLRTHAVRFIGHSVEGFLPNISKVPEVLLRLQELYDWRLKAIAADTSREVDTEELKEFGWWFINGHFDKHWMITTLVKTLELTSGRLGRVYKTIERLPEFTTVDPEGVANALRLIVESDIETYELNYRAESIKIVCDSIKDSGDEAAWDITVRTIDTLGQKGLNQFGELL